MQTIQCFAVKHLNDMLVLRFFESRCDRDRRTVWGNGQARNQSRECLGASRQLKTPMIGAAGIPDDDVVVASSQKPYRYGVRPNNRAS